MPRSGPHCGPQGGLSTWLGACSPVQPRVGQVWPDRCGSFSWELRPARQAEAQLEHRKPGARPSTSSCDAVGLHNLRSIFLALGPLLAFLRTRDSFFIGHVLRSPVKCQ